MKQEKNLNLLNINLTNEILQMNWKIIFILVLSSLAAPLHFREPSPDTSLDSRVLPMALKTFSCQTSSHSKMH